MVRCNYLNRAQGLFTKGSKNMMWIDISQWNGKKSKNLWNVQIVWKGPYWSKWCSNMIFMSFFWFKCMGGLIFSGSNRACLKISKSRSRAQKLRFRLNKGEFCNSTYARVVDQTYSRSFECLNDPILSLDGKVMAKRNCWQLQGNTVLHSTALQWIRGFWVNQREVKHV